MSVLDLSFQSGESSLSVRRFSVHEEMSSLFSISLWARSPNEDIDLATIVGKRASFRVVSGLAHALLGGGRLWSGVCSHMELLQAEPSGLSTYHVRIAPRLWLLTHRRNHRIFQRLSAVDIVDAILTEWHVEPTWQVDRASYPRFEYRVQYGESDYAFISRLLEEAGISFGFVDDEKEGSRLVLWDAPQNNEPRIGLPIHYVDKPNASAEQEYVSQVRTAEVVRPGKLTVRDHDFRRPAQFKLLGETPGVGGEEDDLEQYVYSPGAFKIIQAGGGKSAAASGGDPKKPGWMDGMKDNLVDHADEKVTQVVNDEVTQLLDKALRKVAGSLATDVANDIFAGIAGEVAGNVAGKLLSDAIGGSRESFDVHLERMLRDKMKGAVDGRIAGKVDEKVTKFVTKKLGKMGKGKLGELAAGAAGDVAKEATKAVGGKLIDSLFGEAKQQAEDAAAKAMKMLGSGQPLAGDDKGAVGHDEKAGKALAKRGLESLRAGKTSLGFDTNAIDLRPGTVFSIAGHPSAKIAPTTKLLTTAFSLEGTPGGEWTMSGAAVFADQPYRPIAKTPRPKVEGLQSAVVVGPRGQEIHTDEHGRVRVQFHWDREGGFDDDSSRWMRVSQGWGGPGYGMMSIPRVGTEVVVAFLEGDPDNPIVVGQVFSTTSPVPHKLPDNKTVSAWRGNSSPGGGGFNEILFEDMKGREMVFLQAEKNLRKLVKHDETEITQQDRRVTIGGNLTKMVMCDETETTGVDRTLTVGENLRETVGENHEVLVGGDHTHHVAKNMSLKVGPLTKPKPKDEKKQGQGTDAAAGAAGAAGAKGGAAGAASGAAGASGAPTAAPTGPYAHQITTAQQNGWDGVMSQAEATHGLPAGTLMGVASRETTMRNIVGDHGHGRGLFQIDDRYHGEWLSQHGAGGAGQVPSVEDGAARAAGLLSDNMSYGRKHGVAEADLSKFALSAYNAGPKNALKGYQKGNSDMYTTGGDYGGDVLRRSDAIRQGAGASSPQPTAPGAVAQPAAGEPASEEKKKEEEKKEEVGIFKISATEMIEIEVGQAKLTITKDGKVTLNGVEFKFTATGPVQINGSMIDLN